MIGGIVRRRALPGGGSGHEDTRADERGGRDREVATPTAIEGEPRGSDGDEAGRRAACGAPRGHGADGCHDRSGEQERKLDAPDGRARGRQELEHDGCLGHEQEARATGEALPIARDEGLSTVRDARRQQQQRGRGHRQRHARRAGQEDQAAARQRGRRTGDQEGRHRPIPQGTDHRQQGSRRAAEQHSAERKARHPREPRTIEVHGSARLEHDDRHGDRRERNEQEQPPSDGGARCPGHRPSLVARPSEGQWYERGPPRWPTYTRRTHEPSPRRDVPLGVPRRDRLAHRHRGRARSRADWEPFRLWLLESDSLLERVWGRMDRYHLAWLNVGQGSAPPGASLDDEGTRRFIAEVAGAKLAVLRTMRTSVERQGWTLLSDDDAVHDPTEETR